MPGRLNRNNLDIWRPALVSPVQALQIELASTQTEVAVLEADGKGFSINVSDSSTNVSVADGTIGFGVPLEMNGWSLSYAVATVHTAGNGDTTVQIRRRRAGVNTDVLSGLITIASGVYSVANGTINPANATVQTGDQLYIDVDSIPGNPPTGLTITIIFSRP